MKLIEGFKTVGYRFILLFVFILILLFIMSETVESTFFSWINIIITFIVMDIFISKILSIVSGWKRLEKKFGLEKNKSFKLINMIKFEYGFIDKYPYPLHLLYYEDGILIKVFIFQRYNHKDLRILRWSPLFGQILRYFKVEWPRGLGPYSVLKILFISFYVNIFFHILYLVFDSPGSGGVSPS